MKPSKDKLAREGISSSKDLVEELYANGIDFINEQKSQGVEISPGVSLSSEMIASLDQDIVWYEEMDVEGQ